MRELIFKAPYMIRASRIEKGKYLFERQDKYYEKISTVYTQHGIVVILEIDWATNSGQMKFTIFKTVVNGMVYQADLKEQRLSDRQIQWLATHFIKKIINSGK